MQWAYLPFGHILPCAPQSHKPRASQALLSIGDLPPEGGSVVMSAVSIYMTGALWVLTPIQRTGSWQVRELVATHFLTGGGGLGISETTWSLNQYFGL